MSRPFPASPVFSGNFAPIHLEGEAHDLPVLGTLPPALHGTLYRIGPNPQFAPRDQQYHWFLGDGMVHAFQIERGRVHYRNRWVRTNRFQLEREAGEALFGSWGNPATTDPRVIDEENGLANTNIVWHANRLLALEEADQPVEMDWHDLSTRGIWNDGGKLQGAMTAHPKIDPATGELVFFAYSAQGPFSPAMHYGVVSADGRLQRLDRFDAPYCSMVHDFLVSERHAIFPVMPVTGSMARAMRGEPPWLWEPDKEGWIGVLPRDGGIEQLRWFRTDPAYVFHTVNAWEEGDLLHADVVQYDVPGMFAADGHGTPGRLCRWTFDLAGSSDAVQRRYLDELGVEFPRFDERFATRPYRHAYFTHRHDPDMPRGSYDTLVHFDLQTGARQLHRGAPGDAISEPVFVPSHADAPEGEGWLLATVYRGNEVRSDLVVYDAMRVDAGPIAVAQLSHRVPFGFHGNWRPAA